MISADSTKTMSHIIVGVLAIQGDFERHQQALGKLKVQTLAVKTAEELAQCDGLIIPGGESTTLITLLKKHGLWEALKVFGQQKPIFGTCAGLIILASKIEQNHMDSLKLIDIKVQRNAYGRQVDSFIDRVRLELNAKATECEGVFIRAPKIAELGATVQPLAWHKRDIVMAKRDNILVATFHPELTDDLQVHEYFVRMVK